MPTITSASTTTTSKTENKGEIIERSTVTSTTIKSSTSSTGISTLFSTASSTACASSLNTTSLAGFGFPGFGANLGFSNLNLGCKSNFVKDIDLKGSSESKTDTPNDLVRPEHEIQSERLPDLFNSLGKSTKSSHDSENPSENLSSRRSSSFDKSIQTQINTDEQKKTKEIYHQIAILDKDDDDNDDDDDDDDDTQSIGPPKLRHPLGQSRKSMIFGSHDHDAVEKIINHINQLKTHVNQRPLSISSMSSSCSSSSSLTQNSNNLALMDIRGRRASYLASIESLNDCITSQSATTLNDNFIIDDSDSENSGDDNEQIEEKNRTSSETKLPITTKSKKSILHSSLRFYVTSKSSTAPSSDNQTNCLPSNNNDNGTQSSGQIVTLKPVTTPNTNKVCWTTQLARLRQIRQEKQQQNKKNASVSRNNSSTSSDSGIIRSRTNCNSSSSSSLQHRQDSHSNLSNENYSPSLYSSSNNYCRRSSSSASNSTNCDSLYEMSTFQSFNQNHHFDASTNYRNSARRVSKLQPSPSSASSHSAASSLFRDDGFDEDDTDHLKGQQNTHSTSTLDNDYNSLKRNKQQKQARVCTCKNTCNCNEDALCIKLRDNLNLTKTHPRGHSDYNKDSEEKIENINDKNIINKSSYRDSYQDVDFDDDDDLDDDADDEDNDQNDDDDDEDEYQSCTEEDDKYHHHKLRTHHFLNQNQPLSSQSNPKTKLIKIEKSDKNDDDNDFQDENLTIENTKKENGQSSHKNENENICNFSKQNQPQQCEKVRNDNNESIKTITKSATVPGYWGDPNLSITERVISEIIETERNYVQDLEQIVTGYIYYLRDNFTSESNSKINHEEILQKLFSNLEDIFKFNNQFLQKLIQYYGKPGELAQCFLDTADGFNVYTKYCTQYPEIVSTLTQLMGHPETAEILKQRQTCLQQSLPLGSFLLKPVQRILKYHLLLQNLIKYTAQDEKVNEQDRARVVAALGVMTNIASHINAMKKRHEHAIRVQEIQSILLGWTDGPDLTTLGDLILDATSFKLVNGPTKCRQLFLFDKLLLITKKKRDGSLTYKGNIMCSNLMLIESIDGQPLLFSTIPFDNPRASHTFQARSIDQKREWCLNLKEVIIRSYKVQIPSHVRQILMDLTTNTVLTTIHNSSSQKKSENNNSSNNNNESKNSNLQKTNSPTKSLKLKRRKSASNQSKSSVLIVPGIGSHRPSLAAPDYIERFRLKHEQRRNKINNSNNGTEQATVKT